jgi:hypothetical protein
MTSTTRAALERLIDHPDQVSPHPFDRMGWRFWLCRHCYAPKSLHPRTGWVKARPYGDTEYLSAGAPHFKEGW